MTFGSVCSGIGAAELAWVLLGMECTFSSEIEPFPSAVLKHHYPEVPNLGDFTQIGLAVRRAASDESGESQQSRMERSFLSVSGFNGRSNDGGGNGCSIADLSPGAIDILVGGTPCQDFSVAGLRAGMDGKRGQLTVEFAHLAGRLRPRWLCWENVPGVLSIDEGRAFGVFLRLLGELGYGIAYRILDAQYFGVAQRRRRVFVVGYLGDWRRAAAVLFERESLSGHPPPRREARQGTARGVEVGPSGGRSLHSCGDYGVNGGPAPAIAYGIDEEQNTSEDLMGCLKSREKGGGFEGVVAFAENCRSEIRVDVMPALSSGGGKPGVGYPALHSGMAVRRLTPRECERLQGFPDDYTLISYNGKPAADGPRYKALGNAMAVPVMRWIGERILAVEDFN